MTRPLRMTTSFRQGNDQLYLISTFFATVPSFAFTCKNYKPAATSATFSVLLSAGKVFTTLPDKSASFRLWMCRLLYCKWIRFLAGLGKIFSFFLCEEDSFMPTGLPPPLVVLYI